MKTGSCVQNLELHLQAQVELGTAFRKRAFAAPDPRLRSAWIRHFLRLSDGIAETGSAISRLHHAAIGAESLCVASLRLPRLPTLPELPAIKEGDPPPLESRKTTPSRISNPVRGLQIKAKGGAPKGNANARKSGCHTGGIPDVWPPR